MTATYTNEIATEFTFPNITISRILRDGVHTRYEARPDDGYVMYDTELDPETDGETPFTLASFPKTYNFENFPYVAVLRS